MSAKDLARWEERWRQRTGQPGAPEPFLVRMAASLPAGPALDVAAGDGRNALWLASRGVPVTAVDIAPAAAERLLAAARDQALAIDVRVADLNAPDALAGLGPFASLVVVRFKPSAAQWLALVRALQPGGRVLLCSFRRAQHERHGFPLAYCLDRDQLAAELAPHLRLASWEEFDEPEALLAGLLWDRPGDGR